MCGLQFFFLYWHDRRRCKILGWPRIFLVHSTYISNIYLYIYIYTYISGNDIIFKMFWMYSHKKMYKNYYISLFCINFKQSCLAANSSEGNISLLRVVCDCNLLIVYNINIFELNIEWIKRYINTLTSNRIFVLSFRLL